jgi:hypothetical protein
MKKIIVSYNPTDETWYDAEKYEPVKNWLIQTWPKNYDSPESTYQIALLTDKGKYVTSLVHSCHGEEEIEIAYWKYLSVPKAILEKENGRC